MRALSTIEESAPVRVLVASLCAYEAAAILIGGVPTITALHRRRPVIGRSIVVALAWHFRPTKET